MSIAAFESQVVIGPEFFAKAKNDYANFHWALVREAMQNSMDCGSTRIVIDVVFANGKTTFSWSNDGVPMTREIIVGKLLSLGGSGKGFAGTVGGFGKAKEILYFCHDWFEIESGGFVVRGAGASYTLSERIGHLSGTGSCVGIDGDHAMQLGDAVRRFCSFAQWGGEVVLNGAVLKCGLVRGAKRRDLPFGDVYTNNSHKNRLVVRIGGIPMFVNYISVEKCVVVELNGMSSEVLTSNRDGLLYQHRQVLDVFVAELSSDGRKALRVSKPSYVHFSGNKLSHSAQKSQVSQLIGEVVCVVGACDQSGDVSAESGGVQLPSMVDRSFARAVKSQLVEDFVVKNTTELKIPAYFLPESDEFSSYSRSLVKMWGRLLIQLHKLFEVSGAFTIGFVFDAESEAEYETSPEYGVVYYVNPAKIVRGAAVSLKKRFKLTERNRLLVLAVHEFVHGRGYGRHDDNYAYAFTDMMVKVMDNRKDFNWCF